MNGFNVMITGCSSFSKELIECLKNNTDNVDIKIVGVDCNEHNLLRTGVDWGYVVPKITEPNYIDELIRICTKHDVKIILPYITKELCLLSEKKSTFEKHGIHVSVSSSESLIVANDKKLFGEKYGCFMPAQIFPKSSEDVKGFIETIEHKGGNVCCKINNGCGGQGFFVIDDKKAKELPAIGRKDTPLFLSKDYALQLITANNYNVILQEHKKGLDYSVCVLAENGKIISKVGYVGYSMVCGAVMSGEIKRHERAYEIASKITKELELDGNMCFDFIIDDDAAYLLEVNPRINATLPFVQKAGANLAYLRCLQLLGHSIIPPKIKYGIKMKKYYESEYFF